jgi:hypothetical protein
MAQYADKGGNSGIATYQVSADKVSITFKQGGHYEYPKDPEFVALLQSGIGANAYLNEQLK